MKMGKFMNLFVVVVTCFLNFSAGENSCAIEKSKRLRCGPRDITRDACENIRCCYSNVNGNSECFFMTDSAPRFSIWSSWTECSESCGGGGTERKERACLYEGGHQAPDELCLGESYETRSCNNHRCGEEKEESSTCIERFTARCKERRSECASNKDLQRDCPLTCNTCQQPQTVRPTNAPPSKRECRDISPTCGTAKELCFRGFLSDTFRKWCRKTCNNCEEGTIVVTISPAVTAVPTPAPTLPPTQHPLSECVDEFETCDRVRSMCRQPKHRRTLTLYCRKTCDLCFVEPRATTMPGATTTTPRTAVAVTIATDVAPTDEETCVDKAPASCGNWIQLCGTNDHVNQLCQKSCNLCGVEVGYQGTTTTATQQTVKTTTPTSGTKDLVEVCQDQLTDDRCQSLKTLCAHHLQTRYQLCPKTCGECSTTGEAVVAVTTPETTTTVARTEPITTVKAVYVIAPNPGCVDKYRNCITIQRHCDIDSYRETLRKHCAFTCNIDNCRKV